MSSNDNNTHIEIDCEDDYKSNSSKDNSQRKELLWETREQNVIIDWKNEMKEQSKRHYTAGKKFKRLHEIIKRLYPKALFINDFINSPKDVINSQIPICDLGSLFINNIYDVKKNHKKYLISEPKLTNELKKTLTNKKKRICGLSWISKNYDIGYTKSITLEMLKPILALEDVNFIDLQYSDTQDERNSFFNRNGIEIKKINNIDNFKDLNGLTSLIDACDFIITVSNTNAHIAGALGKKTFLLLPKGKGRLWYWSKLQNKSLWYESIEIIEQNLTGEWKPVINDLSKKLESYANE